MFFQTQFGFFQAGFDCQWYVFQRILVEFSPVHFQEKMVVGAVVGFVRTSHAEHIAVMQGVRLALWARMPIGVVLVLASRMTAPAPSAYIMLSLSWGSLTLDKTSAPMTKNSVGIA
jgi:hypothetical protein